MKNIQDVMQAIAWGASRAEIEAMMARSNCNVTDAQIAMVREMMRDDALEVALNIGCPATRVVEWCAAQGEVRS